MIALRALRPAAVVSLVAAAAFLSPRPAAAEEAMAPARGGVTARRSIDLVLCLDTSGSMQGLIHAARQKMWEVVNECSRARPVPDLRVALLTYGGPGNDDAGHVILQADLTGDLDLVSERLFALGTNGGEEFVGRVVKHALDGLSWAKGPAAKILFVAGNESADQDKVARFRDVVPAAAARGVRVNAIYCGGADDGDAASWREVASLGRGRFASIDHDHGTVAVATPFDAELRRLSGAVNDTYLGFGAKAEESKERQRAQDANAEGAAPAAAAARAASKASGLYDNSGWDLVDRLKKGDVKLADIPDAELPADVRALPVADRAAFVEGKRVERERIQAEIKALDAKRLAFVKDEMARNGLDDSKAFDKAVREAVREQAAEQGFTFEAPTPAPAPAPDAPRAPDVDAK